MKKSILLILSIVVMVGLFAANPNPAAKIEVYYFHLSRRCMTCNNVEKVSKNAVETLYPEMVKNGEIFFKSVNLDENEGEAIGKKYNIESQTLIVIAGAKRVDLTAKGFLYANNSPEKLKAAIKKAVEGLMK
ncbi:MAG: nitrophenyl compound nitroreductase subunit ArsF family protein [Bacteroidales bacterium]|nr:nitrophenyl compound nitroreductase subunit ArsF family protein [Bacteroidales bacterium]